MRQLHQANAFGQYSEERSRVYAGLHGQSYWAKLTGSTVAQVAAVGVGRWRGLGRQQPALRARIISLRSAQCDRGAMHGVDWLAAVSGGLRKVCSNRLLFSVSVRSPPYEARASPRQRSRATQDVTFRVHQISRRYRWVHIWKFRFRSLARCDKRGLVWRCRRRGALNNDREEGLD